MSPQCAVLGPGGVAGFNSAALNHQGFFIALSSTRV